MFVSRHPIVATVSLAIALSACAGAVAFGYVTALDVLGLDPRSDAITIVGVLGNLLLASGIVVVYLRQSTVLEDGLRTLKRQTARGDRDAKRDGTLEAVEKQTESLREGMEVLCEQQRVQRALYTPSLDIDRLRTINSDDSLDTVRFNVTNLSAGDATNLTLRSDVSLIDAPDEYLVSGREATCPLTRTARQQRLSRVPPRSEELGVETNIVVGVSGNTGWGENTFVCDFSDAMRVFYEDGVRAIELTLELVYEDVFGDEYRERIESSRIDLTADTTFGDVLRDREQESSVEESTENRNGVEIVAVSEQNNES